MNTYDEAAFENFCSELVNLGFSPVPTSERGIWTGPIRPSLNPLTDATRMRINFPDGWPLQYARVVVDGLRVEHAANGTICLWADDDPAQVAGRDINVLWARLDAWAAAAQSGFRVEDRALDAYLLYDDISGYRSELPVGDLLAKGGNGFKAPLHAVKKGQKAIFIGVGDEPEKPTDKPLLKGAFYLRRDIGAAPRTLADVRAALTRRQQLDLDHGLSDRTPVALAEPSGGYDFIVLAWPRHDREHDAVVIGFSNQGDSLQSHAIRATPNDTAARKRRAGADTELLSDKTVLIAGAGSVGGHVAVGLAASGITTLRLHDSDYLTTGNLVRHVCPEVYVGYSKTIGVSCTIDDHAPWTKVEPFPNLPHDPVTLAEQVRDVDLVVDCTGLFSLTAALAHVCQQQSLPLVTGALYHQGALARVQRQADGDTPIAARSLDPTYPDLPPEDPTTPDHGFLELGCLAPVNNASPVTVTATAADIVHAAIDFLTGRRNRTNDRIIVFQPMAAPFNRTGTLDAPVAGDD